MKTSRSLPAMSMSGRRMRKKRTDVPDLFFANRHGRNASLPFYFPGHEQMAPGERGRPLALQDIGPGFF